MTIAAFLPLESAAYLRDLIPPKEICFASGWSELESHLMNAPVDLVLVDPRAAGSLDMTAVTRIATQFRGVPVVAYVPLTPENVHAVFHLSRSSLSGALIHPLRDPRVVLFALREQLSANAIAHDLMSLVQTRLADLEPSLFRAVQDLVERPQRYDTAADLARQINAPRKRIYRAFKNAHLGTPKRFVTAAKVMRGYCYLRKGEDPIRSISARVGYLRPRDFAQQVRNIFGCQPSELRREAKVSEVLAHLMEWLCKPPRRSSALRK